MPDFSQPRIDSHHHFFDPQKFPYISDTPYRPEGHELGTVDYYRYVMEAYNIRHSVIIGPTSAYNTDNSYLLDTLKHGAGRFKGIAVVPPDSSVDYLAELKQAGVSGIAMNVAMLGTDRFAQFDSMLAKLHELGLIADIQVTKDQLPDLMPMLLRSKTRLLFDHSGRPDVAAGLKQPGFQALLSLAETDRCWVKLSGLSQFCEPLSRIPKGTSTNKHCLPLLVQTVVCGVQTGRFYAPDNGWILGHYWCWRTSCLVMLPHWIKLCGKHRKHCLVSVSHPQFKQ